MKHQDEDALFSGDGKSVLMIAGDAYGGAGGIALYNRDVIKAIADDATTKRITVVPRLAAPFNETLPPKVDWRGRASRSAMAFLLVLVKIVLSRRPIDIIWCAHPNLLPIAEIIARVTGAKIVLAIYGVESWQPFERKRSIAALKNVDRVVAISEVTKMRFQNWSNFDSDKIRIVANAIDLSLYRDGPKDPELIDRYNLHDREVVMIFGRMHPTERLKGFDELLEVMPELIRRNPKIVAVFAGDGEDRERLIQRSVQLKVDENVRFIGRIRESEKAAHYRIADAFVMPSRQEGFGFVHLEAMASGTPSVASNADGAIEAVRHGKLGFLIDPSNPDDIINKTLAALSTPRHIPDGLSYFAFPRFSAQIQSVLEELTPGG